MMSDIAELLPHVRFRFNLENPTLEECYLFGYECALAHVAEEDNPYEAYSKEADHWSDGWWAGFYGETPLFDIEPSEIEAQNDSQFVDVRESYFARVLEIAGVIAVSAILGYQILDLVA